jgi:ABC-type branched-subunit amino acid transport system permease subunit
VALVALRVPRRRHRARLPAGAAAGGLLAAGAAGSSGCRACGCCGDYLAIVTVGFGEIVAC